MRSFQVLLLLLIAITLVTAVKKSSPKTTVRNTTVSVADASDGDSETVSVSGSRTSGESEQSDTEAPKKEYFSTLGKDIKKAWDSAIKLVNRNSNIWRKDKKGNVILSRDYTKSSPLAFLALVKSDENGNAVDFEAVQEEYYGEGDEDNHLNALKYKAKDQEQDDLLSLIEIALLGNVSDDHGNSYCWVPSLIHQDLFLRHDSARRWHASLFNSDFKYGMAGHNLAFQHMGVGLKDVRRFTERVLDTLDQVNDLMYIHNYQDQCSDVVSQINFVEDKAKRAEDVKNNWGLPRVEEFIEPKPAVVFGKPVVAKSKKLTQTVSTTVAPVKKPTQRFNENDFPSLSMSSSEKSIKNAVTKKKKIEIEI